MMDFLSGELYPNLFSALFVDTSAQSQLCAVQTAHPEICLLGLIIKQASSSSLALPLAKLLYEWESKKHWAEAGSTSVLETLKDSDTQGTSELLPSELLKYENLQRLIHK